MSHAGPIRAAADSGNFFPWSRSAKKGSFLLTNVHATGDVETLQALLHAGLPKVAIPVVHVADYGSKRPIKRGGVFAMLEHAHGATTFDFGLTIQPQSDSKVRAPPY